MTVLSKTYYANGKLLLTGEYLVLKGSKALALPLKLGQRLTVSHDGLPDQIKWNALYKGKSWFSCELSSNDFSVIESTDESIAETLKAIIQVIREISSDEIFQGGMNFESRIDFDPSWGLGSSSTLVSLLAQWSEIDPFLLNEKIFGSSGYDVACATVKCPIFYRINKPLENVTLDYSFTDNLYFIYSGRKKNSGEELIRFKDKIVSAQMIEEISNLSATIALAKNQDEFDLLLNKHERIISQLTGLDPVKKSFHDFKGEIKSLGAWGGDFLLVSARVPEEEVKPYFRKKGLEILFRWDELVLKEMEDG